MGQEPAKRSFRLGVIVCSALALTIVVCTLCRNLFGQEVVLVDCLLPDGYLTALRAVIYYKSGSDPQFSKRQKCSQAINAEYLSKSRNHVVIEVPRDATECRFDLGFARPVSKTIPIEFCTRDGMKTYKVRIPSWNRNVVVVNFATDEFRKIRFKGLSFLSFSTIVFLGAFAIGLFVIRNIKCVIIGRGIILPLFSFLILAPNKEVTKADASGNENRNLAKFPDMAQFGLLDVSEYCKLFSAAYEDRFWGRDNLMSLHNSILKGFDNRGNASVFIGRNGWLFYNRTLRDFSNKAKPYDDQVFDVIYGRLKAFSEYAHKNGKVFVFFVAPDKCRVYPEFVHGYKKKKSDDESRTEQLISRLRERCDFPIVYPRKQMLELKREMPYPLYFKNDTHWTYETAFLVGYQGIMNAIMNDKHYHGDVVPLKIDTWRTEKCRCGDLTRQLHLATACEEQDYNFPVCLEKSVKRRIKKSMKPFEHAIVSSTNSRGRMRIFCRGDSFMNRMRPFFECTFKECYYAHVLIGLTDEDLSAMKESDVIVLEIVERDLLLLRNLTISQNL